MGNYSETKPFLEWKEFDKKKNTNSSLIMSSTYKSFRAVAFIDDIAHGGYCLNISEPKDINSPTTATVELWFHAGGFYESLFACHDIHKYQIEDVINYAKYHQSEHHFAKLCRVVNGSYLECEKNQGGFVENIFELSSPTKDNSSNE